MGEAVRHARSLATIDWVDLSRSRLRLAKQGLLRLLRVITVRQSAFNHRVVDALEELAEGTDALGAELAGLRASLERLEELLASVPDGDLMRVRRLEHEVRRVHGPLVVDIIDRLDGLLDPPGSAQLDGDR